MSLAADARALVLLRLAAADAARRGAPAPSAADVEAASEEFRRRHTPRARRVVAGCDSVVAVSFGGRVVRTVWDVAS